MGLTILCFLNIDEKQMPQQGFAHGNKRWAFSHLAGPTRRNDDVSVDVLVPEVPIPGFNFVFTVEMSQRCLCHVDTSVRNRKYKDFGLISN